jgi:hypothetical protein
MQKQDALTCCKMSWLSHFCHRAVLKHRQEELDAGLAYSLTGIDHNIGNTVCRAVIFQDKGGVLTQDQVRKRQREQYHSFHTGTNCKVYSYL